MNNMCPRSNKEIGHSFETGKSSVKMCFNMEQPLVAQDAEPSSEALDQGLDIPNNAESECKQQSRNLKMAELELTEPWTG